MVLTRFSPTMAPTQPMSSPNRQEQIARALVITVPALWAINYVVARKAPGVIDPHTLALGRWGIAGLLLGLFSWRELWRERRWLLTAWPQHLVLPALVFTLHAFDFDYCVANFIRVKFIGHVQSMSGGFDGCEQSRTAFSAASACRHSCPSCPLAFRAPVAQK